MLGTYDLMPAAVATGVEHVVIAGSNCALGHGYRISQTPFPFQALPIDESHPAFPALLPYADRLHGYGPFFSTQKLAQAVG
jgi:hypothetical protein